MSDEKKVEVKDEGKSEVKAIAAMKKQVDGMAYVLRKLLPLIETHFGVDLNKDGKLGAVRGWLPAFILVLFGVGLLGWATTHQIIDWTAGGPFSAGVAKITYDDSTSLATLTVDAIAASNQTFSGNVSGVLNFSASNISNLTGNLVASNITAKGTITAPAFVTVTTVWSNNNAFAYVSNLTMRAGGTLTLPAGAVGADDVAAGTMANTMIYSNANNIVYGSNLTVVTGGTITVPAGSVASAAIAAGTMANVMNISNNNTLVTASNITVGTFLNILATRVSVSAIPVGSATVSVGELYIDTTTATSLLAVK